MLAVFNHTPLLASLIPHLDKEGADWVVFVVKGSFRIGEPDAPLLLEDEQAPIVLGDEHHGEPGESSLLYETETSPPNGHTDVALVGHAHADREACTEMQVSLEVGPLRKVLRVVGDRRWYKSLGFTRQSEPEPFEKLPLVYERAYGGRDLSHDKEAKHGVETRNPIGCGFAVSTRSPLASELPMPNIEDPSAPIESIKQRPAPAGFGFISRNWLPRSRYAGTYDAAWERDRSPLLPLDFDPLFFSAAHPDLISEAPLQGGERVRAQGVAEYGEIRCSLPVVDFDASASVDGQRLPLDLELSRVLIEPDERRLSLTWKAAIRCPRGALYLESVTLRTRTPLRAPRPPEGGEVIPLPLAT